MTHEDAGHYAAKHPKGTKENPQIAKALRQTCTDGRITCTAAHKISQNLNADPSQVGVNIDLLELRLSKCRLGLFGYKKKKKIVEQLENVPQELDNALKGFIIDNHISCAACWAIASKIGCSKLEVSGACESLKIKISPCQFGAF